VVRRYIFDQSNATIDSFTPLKALPQWDKRIRSCSPSSFYFFQFFLTLRSRQQKVEGADSVFAAGLDDPRSVVVQVRLFGLHSFLHHLHTFLGAST